MSGYTGVTNMNGQPGYLPTADDCSGSELETLCCASGTKLGTCTWRGWRGVGLPCSGGCNSGETVIAQNTNHHDTVDGKLQIQTCNGGLQSYCCSDFVAPTSLQTSSKEVSLQEDDLDLNPIVSVVVATVTEALANAAKSVIDAVATDFCDVAVPAFLEVVDDIELAIPSEYPFLVDLCLGGLALLSTNNSQSSARFSLPENGLQSLRSSKAVRI